MNEGVAEFWVKLMETHHKCTAQPEDGTAQASSGWFFATQNDTRTKSQNVRFFSLSTRDEGSGVCVCLFPGYVGKMVDEPFLLNKSFTIHFRV